jgi:hypothetical protein
MINPFDQQGPVIERNLFLGASNVCYRERSKLFC